MLMYNKKKYCKPVILDMMTKKPIVTISMPENMYASSYYDHINNGFIIYWRGEKFENEAQQVNVVFKYIDLSTLKEKNIPITPPEKVAGISCYPDMLIPEKGAIRYISGCESTINNKQKNNRGILIKI